MRNGTYPLMFTGRVYNQHTHTHTHIYIYIYIYIYHQNIYIHTFPMKKFNLLIYIYIYIHTCRKIDNKVIQVEGEIYWEVDTIAFWFNWTIIRIMRCDISDVKSTIEKYIYIYIYIYIYEKRNKTQKINSTFFTIKIVSLKTKSTPLFAKGWGLTLQQRMQSDRTNKSK